MVAKFVWEKDGNSHTEVVKVKAMKKELVLFGVNGQLVAEAEALGATIAYIMAGNGGSFKISSSDGAVGGTVPVTGQVMTLVKVGSLGPASKQAIQYQIEGFLNKVIMYQKTVKSPTGPFTEITFFDTPENSENVGGCEMSETVIPLKEATKVKQIVLGTSAGSTYIVVAILKGAAIAVRWKNSTMSVRVEGQSMSDYVNALKDLGFLIKKDYASVHYDVNECGLVCKTVGAILGRIGFQNVVDTCNIEEAVGQ